MDGELPPELICVCLGFFFVSSVSVREKEIQAVCVFMCVCDHAGVSVHVNRFTKEKKRKDHQDKTSGSVGPWLPAVARQQEPWQQVEA